jgi:zinc and cadmium transporter
VLLHEIPQELADFGILIHSGLCVRRAVLLNRTSASVAQPFHCWLAPSLRKPSRPRWVPLTAGGFVYLAAADLIPELQHERGLHAGCANESHRTGHCGYGSSGIMKLTGDAIAFLQF